MKEVFTGKYLLYDNQPIFAKVSQCVAVGVVSDASGIAHIHCNTKLKVLDDFFKETFSSGSIYMCGGVDAFVPQMGFIPGSKNAGRVLDYLSKNNIEKYLEQKDIYSDYVRLMRLDNAFCKIDRLIS